MQMPSGGTCCTYMMCSAGLADAIAVVGKSVSSCHVVESNLSVCLQVVSAMIVR